MQRVNSTKEADNSPFKEESSLLAENSFVIIGILMSLGLAFIILFSINEGRNWGNILSVISLVMLASFAVGAILGFIFGIPRTLQGDGDTGFNKQDGTKTDNMASVKANTNLEQLSDWLTKIIVGVGLVEFKEIASSIAALSERLSSGIMDSRFGFTMVSATIIFYLLMGFLICYLWTRIYFEKILKSQIDNDRLNELEQGKNVIEGKLNQLEQTKNIQGEFSDLKESFRLDKAREVIENIIRRTDNVKEQANLFQEIIVIAFEKRDYFTINELVSEFDSKIYISAKTWADVAIANMNLYDNTHNAEYYQKSLHACDRSIRMLADYGVPQMIKIYLELIKYKIARNNNQEDQLKNIRAAIEDIVKDMQSRGLVTSYEAYNYYLQNTTWADYNNIFQTEFKNEYTVIHEEYKEYLKKQQSKS